MYPTHIRKTKRLMVGMTILAWALQVAFGTFVRGQEPAGPRQLAQLPVELGGDEKWVPGGQRFYTGATLELKSEVTLIGEEVKLKQVARWADADKGAFEPIADLVLFRLSRQNPYRTVTVRELRDTLHDAGVNLAVLRFAGATTCTVARTDVKFDERTALEEWVASKEAATTKPALITVAPVTRPAAGLASASQPPTAFGRDPQESATPTAATATAVAAKKDDPKPFKTLKDHLTAEAAERLGVAPEQLQFHFNPADDKLLRLTEPHFAFHVGTPRNKNLGEVTWDISVVADGQKQKASVTGTVKAWQSQLVVNKPLGYRQVIREDDLVDRRALVDRLSEDPLVTREQVVGQMAGRDLKSGTILTARLIEPTLLVKSGQLVSVTLTQGAIQAKSVARATEQGTIGQTIRVKNEVTGNVFDVVVTGPQSAKLPGRGPDKADIATLQINE
jgi:flagella basal body P-ring formation protein FlgA